VGPTVPRERAARHYALVAFGEAMHGTTLEDLSGPNFVLQIGIPPVRIDVITFAAGLSQLSTRAVGRTRKLPGWRAICRPRAGA
jgi:hypothetical protein